MAKIVRFLVQPLSLVSKKLANIATSVALIGAGIITGNPGLIAAGVSSLSSALKKKPKASVADRSRLLATIDPRAPRTLVFGRTAMGTDIRDQEFTGTAQEFLHRFIVVASHKVSAIQEIWFDDKLAWTSAGGVQAAFTGYLTVAPILEGSAANAINISARMGSTRRYTGLAYVHFRYKLTGNSKKSESPFSSAVPSRITIIGRGMSVYDPRQDSTAGGSGLHRANDQSTWTYNSNHARNPALQALTYMLGWRINGLLAVGKGIPPARFDMASFITAANVCDELQALKAGGTESRYRFDGVFSEADDLSTVLGAFSGAMDARFYDPQGRIAVKCIVNDLASPVATFGPADVLDEVIWSPFGDLSESYNIVRGTFTDPSTTSLYQSVDYPEQSVASVDGIDRILTLDFAGVQSATQAQRLAKRALVRAQLGGGTLSCEMQATAWRCEQLSPVSFTFPALGISAKPFRVAEIEARVDGTVPISLEVEDAAIYAWNPATDERDGLAPVANTPYLPTNNPFAIDIGQSFLSIIPPPSQTIFADSAGVPLAGQFNRVLKPAVTSLDQDVRTADYVTYAITTANVTATINNTIGSAEKGWITVTAGGSGYIDLTVTVSGIAYGPHRIVFTRTDAVAVPSSGSFGSRSTFSTVNSAALIELFTPINVTVGAGQTVTMTAPLEYNATGSADVDVGLEARWQRSPAGAGVWTSVSSFVLGSDATWVFATSSGTPGSGSYPATDTPAAASYDYRMQARLSNIDGSPILNVFSGTATVTVA